MTPTDHPRPAPGPGPDSGHTETHDAREGLRGLLGDRYDIQSPAQLAHVLSEKLDDYAPLNENRKWRPLADELWARITAAPVDPAEAWDEGYGMCQREFDHAWSGHMADPDDPTGTCTECRPNPYRTERTNS